MLPDPRPDTRAIAHKHPLNPPNGQTASIARRRVVGDLTRMPAASFYREPAPRGMSRNSRSSPVMAPINVCRRGDFYACWPLTGSAIDSSSQPSVSLAALKAGTGRSADSAAPKLARLPSAAIRSLIFLASSFVGV